MPTDLCRLKKVSAPGSSSMLVMYRPSVTIPAIRNASSQCKTTAGGA
jgi:hypothetical protein